MCKTKGSDRVRKSYIQSLYKNVTMKRKNLQLNINTSPIQSLHLSKLIQLFKRTNAMWLFFYVKHIIKSRGFIEVFGSDMVSYIKHVLFVALLFKATSVMSSFENDVLLDTNINFLYMKCDLECHVSVQCNCCFIADRSNISVLLALQKAESGLVMSNSTLVMGSEGFKHLEESCPSLLSELLETVALVDEKSNLVSGKKRSGSSIFGLDLAADGGGVAESGNPSGRRLCRRI